MGNFDGSWLSEFIIYSTYFVMDYMFLDYVFFSDKFRSIISIARKHNILVLTDDVYNFFHYGEVGNISPPFPAPPRRMVSLDEP